MVTEVSTRSLHLPLALQIEAESLQRLLAVRRQLELEAARLASLHANGPSRGTKLDRAAELMAVYKAAEDWRPADFRIHAASTTPPNMSSRTW